MRCLAVVALVTGCSFTPGVLGVPAGDAAFDDAGADDAPIDVPGDAAAVRATSGLIALYTFEEGSGTIVMDRSGVGGALDLTIETPAAATWGQGTLAVTGEGQIRSAGAATKILEACSDADALTLEAWIQPAMLITAYFPRVVTLSSSSNALAATLMAINDHFELRIEGPVTDSNGLPALSSPAGSVALAPMHVVLVNEPTGARRIYIDGVESVSDTMGGDLADWTNSHRLGLGNEIDGGRAWLGTFDLVAFYARALDPDEVAQNFAAGPR